MQKNKKFFIYKTRIILTNGSSLKINSIKYFKNYQLNLKIFKEKKIITNINSDLNENKSNFIKKIS
uniref:Orf64 n=1 Tax=Peronospora tabacina TaxID=230439 RepID=A0A0P0HEW2_9STRA|nr:orf64 [Peronospora tabacina]ALJ78459.1 orf64 [Peronospora tabacina]ALJ78506.1 orf64 [Peronospora tabacina]